MMAMRLLLSLLVGLVALPAAGAVEPGYPRARPLTDRTFEPTPARVERGQYLTEHLLQCFVCHSERDWDLPGAPPKAGRKGAGSIMSEREGRRIVAPNITPDPDTGAGHWTDDMLARAIREGIGHDGRALYWGMWYRSFSGLADEDLASVVVYLRTLPAVRNALPPTLLPEEEAAANAMNPKPITDPVSGPPPGDSLALGRYLIGVADCTGCHTGWEAPRNPGLLGGGNHIGRGTRQAFSSNITRHESGVSYPKETFIAVMHSGKGGSLHPIMPWTAFSGLNDTDLGAIYEALGLAYPVAHYIGNVGEPTHCEVCGQEHPFGDLNHLALPKAVAVPAAVTARLTGDYTAAEEGWTIRIRSRGGKLYAQDNFSDSEFELIALSPTRYLPNGNFPAPLSFRLPDRGAATQLVSEEVNPLVLGRVAQ
jgi:mono/diheme cytochrome c family protein